MTTIVMNTATGAVSEYGWTFQSVSAQHAGDASGLHTLGGNSDNGALITGEFRTGKPGGSKVQGVDNVYLALHGQGAGVLIVQGRDDEWEYPVAARPSGVSVAKPGKGISESYLGFGFRNTAGAAFRIDRIDAEVTQSINRRK